MKTQLQSSFTFKKMPQYFLQGLVIIVPMGISIYAVLWMFHTVDSLLPNIIHNLFPGLIDKTTDGQLKRYPGIGFIVTFFIVILIGRISSSFIVSRIVAFVDTILEHTPGVKFIYSPVKDFLESFTGNKKKFDRPVLVNIDSPGVWRIGFITQEDANKFEMEDHVVVYLPQSYAIAGLTYIVEKEKIKPLHNIGGAEAMKFVVSGGVAEVE
jgi:uncharacterized membrane protein